MLNQLRRQGRQSVVMTIRRTIFDRDGLALDEPNFAQAFPERIHQRRQLRESLMEEPDHWYRSLLGARYERPRGRRAANQSNDPAPVQFPHGVALPTCRPGGTVSLPQFGGSHRPVGRSLGWTLIVLNWGE